MADDLVVRGLRRRFGGVTALGSVAFTAEAGGITAVIGPNGAGKTTLFNCISGLDRPDAGEVALGGVRLTGRPPHEVAALGVARTFQTLQVFGTMSVVDNVRVAAERARGGGGPARRDAPARAERSLELAGLAALAARPARALAFGEQRRLEIARALALEPRVLLLDEPASGLSRAEVDALADVVRAARRAGTTVLLIEHDVATVMAVADRVVVLEHGEVIASGPPAEVRADPRVVDAYLGTGGADPAAVSAAAAEAARALAGEAGSGLEIADVHAGHGDLRVLHGVSLAVPPARVTALIGANGAGKSTLLAAASGLLPARGIVRLDGADVSRLPAERRAAAGLTLVPERRQLFERLTVFEHLLVGGYARTGPWTLAGAARRKLAHRIAAVERLFPRLAERRSQLAGTLSGGEQQMLALARGLMGKPRCVLLDEPSLGLAPSLVAAILQVLASLAEAGMPVLLVEQNARAALRVARHAAVLERGRVVAEGDAEAIAEDPRVRAAYLGV